MSIAYALHHVSIHVRDVHASAEFYARVLGLEEMPNRVGKAHIRWFRLDGYRTLHLIGGDPEERRARPKSAHVALTTPEFGAAVAHLEREGVGFVGRDHNAGEIARRADGVRQIYFQDPDGNWIEITDAGEDP